MRDDNTVVVDRPNERRSILWWIIPLLLLLLLGIGLLYYFMVHKNTDDGTIANKQSTTGSSTTGETSQSQAPQGTVTNLATLLTASDPNSLTGKKVSLSSATVDQVIGDKSFTLGSPTDHVYALLSDRLNSGQTEQAVKVQGGETRSIEGTVVKAPDDMTILMEQFQLSQEQADELKSQGFYISVDQTAQTTNSDNGVDMPTGAGTE